MLNDIYNKQILQLASSIARHERLSNPQAIATAHSKLCGSKITVDLSLDQGLVSAFGQEVKACALGQASASLLAQHVIGTSPTELRELRQIMYAMLKENGPPPQGKWQGFEAFIPVRDFPARHASTLLIFDAVNQAIADIETKERTSA